MQRGMQRIQSFSPCAAARRLVDKCGLPCGICLFSLSNDQYGVIAPQPDLCVHEHGSDRWHFDTTALVNMNT